MRIPGPEPQRARRCAEGAFLAGRRAGSGHYGRAVYCELGFGWYGMVWYDVMWCVRYGMVRYGMVLYGMVFYGVVLYGMVLYGMARHGMVSPCWPPTWRWTNGRAAYLERETRSTTGVALKF